MEVLYLFVVKGNRRASYKKIFGDRGKSQAGIYRWFARTDVQSKIVEIGQSLAIYDTVCDKVLLDIIINEDSANRDKIQAIKTWNDLRARVHTNIKISVADKIDFSNVSDENLESIVKAILSKNNESVTNNAGN